MNINVSDSNVSWCIDCKSKISILVSRIEESVNEVINKEYEGANEKEKETA